MRVFAEIVGGLALLGMIALVIIVVRAWPVEATLKATTSAGAISIAAGLSIAGLSASAAAILDGPGVLAVHLRARPLWRKPIPRVSIEAAVGWIDAQLSKPKETSRFSRFKDWLLARTDTSALPELGVKLLAGLREVSLRGTVGCGFSDPAWTGKTAAWLYPLAGALSPLGRLDVDFDWSGANRLDADVEVSCRLVPMRAIFESLRFARHHIHPLHT